MNHDSGGLTGRTADLTDLTDLRDAYPAWEITARGDPALIEATPRDPSLTGATGGDPVRLRALCQREMFLYIAAQERLETTGSPFAPGSPAARGLARRRPRCGAHPLGPPAQAAAG